MAPVVPHQPPIPPLPRTLILDYRDSYTNNLLSLFVSLYSDDEVKRKVVVVQADEVDWSGMQGMLGDLDCIVLSPGPGRPDNAADIGFALELIKTTSLPLLGICLGMQSLAVAYGAKIINTPDLKHGHVIPISHRYRGIFDLLPLSCPTTDTTTNIDSVMDGAEGEVGNGKAPFGADKVEDEGRVDGEEGSGLVDMVTYNSLTVDPTKDFPDELEVIAWHDDWQVMRDGTRRSVRTIQGLAHRRKCQYGVQFHPESIASSSGSRLLLSFLLKSHQYHQTPHSYPPLTRKTLRMSSTYRLVEESRAASRVGSRTGSPGPTASRLGLREQGLESVVGRGGDVDEVGVLEGLVQRAGRGRGLGAVWLDGVSNRAPTTASMAIPNVILSYSLQSRTVTCHYENLTSARVSTRKLRLSPSSTFWNWFSRGSTELRSRLRDRPAGRRERPLDVFARTKSDMPGPSARPADTRWRGGWVGWWGYEMKEESLGGYERESETRRDADDRPDACWAWCDRTLQCDQHGDWIARGIVEQDPRTPSTPSTGGSSDVVDEEMEMVDWLEGLGLSFGASSSEWNEWVDLSEQAVVAATTASTTTSGASLPQLEPRITAQAYMDGIAQCRKAIFDGNSYELTLTTQFKAKARQQPSEALKMYASLRKRNPAPYSSYIHFPVVGTTIMSSSPERFIRIDADGKVEMKPIKGTRARVRCRCASASTCPGGGGARCADVCAKLDTEVGEALRADGKERAENLMIVDLIRSDLQSCCSPSSVQVPKLIALETYESVHQLVTTVVGRLEQGISEIEAVERCFPPGSMTGAPKLRSVQILDDLESPYERRGVYSGALGYMGIDGEVDLSVVIRTVIAEYEPVLDGGMQPTDIEYSLGAGGAITWLSRPEGEWEEVLTKVGSVVGR